MIFMHCSLQLRQKHIHIRHFRAPVACVVTQFIVKVKRKIEKKNKFYHFSFSQYSPNVEVKIVQAVIA